MSTTTSTTTSKTTARKSTKATATPSTAPAKQRTRRVATDLPLGKSHNAQFENLLAKAEAATTKAVAAAEAGDEVKSNLLLVAAGSYNMLANTALYATN